MEYKDNNQNFGNQDFYELSEFREEIDHLPLTSYFEETKDNVKTKIFGEWLKIVDNDTLDLLIRTAEFTIFEDPNSPNLLDLDNFPEVLYKVEEDDEDDEDDEEILEIEEINEIKDAIDNADYFSLCLFATGWELGSSIIPKNDFEKAVKYLYLLAVGEDFVRKGICKIEGPNSILDGNETIMNITPEGRLIAKNLKRKWN